MRSIIFASVVFLLAAGFVLAQPMSQNNYVNTPPPMSQQATRSCMYPIGGWTKVDCSNAVAATSAQLNAWSRYVIQCGDDSYIATGDEATDVADANDGWLPTGAWLSFITTDSVRYISCLNKTVDSDCRYWECR